MLSLSSDSPKTTIWRTSLTWSDWKTARTATGSTAASRDEKTRASSRERWTSTPNAPVRPVIHNDKPTHTAFTCRQQIRSFLACDAFVRTNHRAIAMVFVRSVRLSVSLSGTGVHCDHMMHVSAYLSLWLDSAMFWTPWHQSMSTYSQPSFSSSTWKRGGVGCAN